MPRPTTKAEVAERFAALLGTYLPDLVDKIYWVIGDRTPPSAATQDQIWVTFCFTGGTYDHPNQVGAGVLDYHGTIRVSVWQSSFLDEPGTHRQLLIGPEGLYRIQGRLLRVRENYLEDIHSTDSRGDGLLLEGIKVLSDDESCEASAEQFENFHGIMSVDFGIDFQWDLTAE
jgi:hypothetical protein